MTSVSIRYKTGCAFKMLISKHYLVLSPKIVCVTFSFTFKRFLREHCHPLSILSVPTMTKGWAKLKLGVGGSIWVCHMGAGIQVLELGSWH